MGIVNFNNTVENSKDSFAAKNEQAQNASAEGTRITELNATPCKANCEYTYDATPPKYMPKMTQKIGEAITPIIEAPSMKKIKLESKFLANAAENIPKNFNSWRRVK
ncbi:MAG: hypothetical protein IKZ59_01455 [Clostridia bacterium]|nr:hypothetical protein [Clostridia bacterium]